MISGSTMMLNMDPAIINALREDVTSEDVSTNAIMRQPQLGKAELICKQDGIICGLDVFARVFEILEEEAHFETTYADGDEVKKGQLIGVIYADIRTLLTGERTALNFLQRMSGIATNTNKMVKILEGKHTTLLDTRKTTPGLRIFEKYAVRCGGATNHRYNLSDCVMMKDNHICAAGSITKAVQMAREYVSFVTQIEVECETLELLHAAQTLSCWITWTTRPCARRSRLLTVAQRPSALATLPQSACWKLQISAWISYPPAR